MTTLAPPVNLIPQEAITPLGWDRPEDMLAIAARLEQLPRCGLAADVASLKRQASEIRHLEAILVRSRALLRSDFESLLEAVSRSWTPAEIHAATGYRL